MSRVVADVGTGEGLVEEVPFRGDGGNAGPDAVERRARGEHPLRSEGQDEGVEGGEAAGIAAIGEVTVLGDDPGIVGDVDAVIAPDEQLDVGPGAGGDRAD